MHTFGVDERVIALNERGMPYIHHWNGAVKTFKTAEEAVAFSEAHPHQYSAYEEDQTKRWRRRGLYRYHGEICSI